MVEGGPSVNQFALSTVQDEQLTLQFSFSRSYINMIHGKRDKSH